MKSPSRVGLEWWVISEGFWTWLLADNRAASQETEQEVV